MLQDNSLIIILLIGVVVVGIIYFNYNNKKLENYDNGVTPSPLLTNVINTNSSDKHAAVSENPSTPLNITPSILNVSKPTYSNGIAQNPSQTLLQTPPTMKKDIGIEKTNTDIAKQLISNSKQQMFNDENSKYQDKQYQSFSDDQGYMLLPSANVPDKKFEKVMPKNTRPVLTSADMLPKEENSDWFQNPNKDFNLMQSVDLEIPEIKIGVDTIAQSQKFANHDLRAPPINPKYVVSPWNNSTAEPDYNTKPF